MKRKFFTLLAASLAMGASAYAQCPQEGESLIGKTIDSGEYYYLHYTSNTAANINADSCFSITKTAAGDSIIAVAHSGIAAELDSAIWKVVKLDDKYYTFQNKATGNNFSLKVGGTTSAAKFGWNYETAGNPEKLSFINNFKNYQVDVTATDVVKMIETASAGINVYPALPGWKKVTLGELNAMYSDYFTLKDNSATSPTDQAKESSKAIQSKFHATDLRNDRPATTTYFLNVVGTNTYLNVDTAYYDRIGLIDSTKKLGGHTLKLDTMAVEKEASTYMFTIWKNVKDSIAIQVHGIPAIAATGQTFKDQVALGTATTSNAWITLSSYDAGYKETALTAAEGCFNKYMPNPRLSLAQGKGKQIEAGYYYIYKGMKQDTMLVASLNNALQTENFIWTPANAGAQYVAAAQWYVPSKSYLPSIYNRESTQGAGVSSMKFYEVLDKDGNVVENTYQVQGGIAGVDTIVMKKFTSDDIYLGYKKFGKTAAEEAITEVYLQFNTKITGTDQKAYIVKTAYATDSLLQVRLMDKEISRAYKIAPVDTFSIGADKLVAVSYNLYYTEGGKTYYVAGYEGDGNQVKHTSKRAEADAYLMRATYEKDQYQILTVAPGTWNAGEVVANRIVAGNLVSLNSRYVNDQVSVAASSAEVYNNFELNLLNGTWSFVNTLTPEYLTLERGHYRIYSSENTSLAVTVNPKNSAAILKAEADVPGYENGWFSMYVSPYETDTVRPTYFIGTTQQGMISEADRKAGHVSYMTNAGTFKKPINTETTAQDSISFVNGLVGAELDSISIFANNKLQSKTALAKTKKAYFAFLKVAKGQDNEAYIESVRGDEKVYLAQSNGVLYFNSGVAGQPAINALKFVFGAPNKDVVTGNDPVSAETVKVVASEGKVIIANAAGKNVVITNILGQVIANTVIASDNAAIAAPAGVVVVAVEGEEAVKAIVK